MSTWKHRPSSTSFAAYASLNTGMSEAELLNDTKQYFIKSLDEAVRVAKAEVSKGAAVTIVGDYDVDGVTASAIMKLAFASLGVDAKVRIPRRFSEGYGLNPGIIDEINSGLLITVDNGIAAVEAVQKAVDKGLTVIVTDHHLGPEDGIMPNANVTVDPNAIQGSDFNGYCGAGLAYRFACCFPETESIRDSLLALACIGTICDVMPLTWENRRIVKEGLKLITARKNLTVGLRALLDVSNLEGDIDPENIAFKIGPMLNAPGRLYDNGAEKSFRLLSFNGTDTEARKMAEELNEDNEKRKNLSTVYQERIEANIAANCLYGDIPMVVYEPDLNEGMIGILAGKCSERYKVPAIVFTDAEKDGKRFLKGSARSPEPYNIKELLDQTSDLLLGYGGHKGAAGLRIAEDDLDEFRYRIGIEAAKVKMPEVSGDSVLLYDFDVKPDGIGNALEEMKKFGPYGAGNPMPVFRIKGFRLYPSSTGFYRTMGNDGQHIKLLGNQCDVIGFDMAERYHDTGDTHCLDILGTLGTNTFFGRTKLQVLMCDFKDAAKKKEPTLLAGTLLKMAAERY